MQYRSVSAAPRPARATLGYVSGYLRERGRKNNGLSTCYDGTAIPFRSTTCSYFQQLPGPKLIFGLDLPSRSRSQPDAPAHEAPQDHARLERRTRVAIQPEFELLLGERHRAGQGGEDRRCLLRFGQLRERSIDCTLQLVRGEIRVASLEPLLPPLLILSSEEVRACVRLRALARRSSDTMLKRRIALELREVDVS